MQRLPKKILIATITIAIVFFGLIAKNYQNFHSTHNINLPISQQETIKIAMCTTDMAGLPYMILKENKLLEKHGLIPQFNEVDPSLLLNVLLDNQSDIAMGTSWPSLGGLEIEQPGLIKIAGAGGETASSKPMNGILVLPNSPINSMADLRGKIIAGENPRNNLVLKIILKKFNIDPEKDTEIIEIGKNLIANALIQKKADAIFVFQPSLASISEKVNARIVDTNIRAKYIVDPYFSGPLMMVREDYAKYHTDIIQKFAESLEEATEYISKNPEEAKKIATKYTSLTPDLVEKTGAHFFIGPLSEISKDKIQTVTDILSTGGVLKQKINIPSMYLRF